MKTPCIRLTVDGRQVLAEPGMNLIEAAKLVGIEIPGFCYHPKLCIAGNCRMCLVEAGTPKFGPNQVPELGPDGQPVIHWPAKLTIACNTRVSEGMVVRTRTPRVIRARQGVMEYLLINHPLDCPICDQAGECRLQELAVDYGRATSRFVEDKEKKPKRAMLGPKIVLDNERCILCSRCVRFMRDVAGQDCLGFVQRGGRSYLACYPGQEPKTNYDLNIVDLCPVGALTSVDFRFKQRVWFLKETRSICPHCATGCNIVISSRENVVYRQTPRDNDAVNQCWMCDDGRLNYKFINDARRLKEPTEKNTAGTPVPLGWPEAIRRAASRLAAVRDGGPGRIAAVGSARATTEELCLFGWVADALQAAPRDIVPRRGQADHLLLHADRNPNTRGATLAGVAAHPAGSRLPQIAQGIQQGAIRALLVLGEDMAECGIGPDLLAKLDALVVIGVLPDATTMAAHTVLPGASYAEKSGTFINARGRIQRIDPAVAPPGAARPEWQTLSALLMELGGPSFASLESVVEQMARVLPPLAKLTLARIGHQGVQLDME